MSKYVARCWMAKRVQHVGAALLQYYMLFRLVGPWKGTFLIVKVIQCIQKSADIISCRCRKKTEAQTCHLVVTSIYD